VAAPKVEVGVGVPKLTFDVAPHVVGLAPACVVEGVPPKSPPPNDEVCCCCPNPPNPVVPAVKDGVVVLKADVVAPVC